MNIHIYAHSLLVLARAGAEGNRKGVNGDGGWRAGLTLTRSYT